jgi:conjugal transfer ATP-binding protein TraC
MNSVVLATSGAGKSFLVKLEVLRYLLNGIDVIIIDPENEYK